MSETTNHQPFQAEVGQLLEIVTHSLYTDREIFVRELVSNAADALERLRHLQLTEKSVFDDSLPLEINITTDDQAGTITFQDFGVGMNREELKENLGTIAHSGSKSFLQALQSARESGKTTDSLNLIGQFGVGFYSAFMVADSVQVYTHSWHPEGEHLLWESDGRSGYTITENHGQRRGCKVVLKLKAEEKGFARAETIKSVLGRYSSFVPFPINLNGERVNTVQALWMRNRNEIKDEEYSEFYKYQANAFDEPSLRLHFTADAPIAINALLFVPQDNPERWGFGRIEPGVALYCKRVLIDPHPEKLLPEWLRFLKGVVDSPDLPLNISRESMQDSGLVRKINQALTGRFLKFLEEEASKRPESYARFYQNFGIYLKEGSTLDGSHRERLSKLLRFESSLTESGQTTSLSEYVGRITGDRKEIIYLHGPDRATLEHSPHLEAFRVRNIEVLFLFEPIDAFVMSHLREFDGRKLVSGDQADISLEEVPLSGEALPHEEATSLCAWLKECWGDRVESVVSGHRLVETPLVALNTDRFLTPAMRRLMKSMGPERGEWGGAESSRIEVNPRHPLVRKLHTLRQLDPETAGMIAEQMLDNAKVSAGVMENPASMVSRLHSLLEKLTERSIPQSSATPPADPS